MPPAHTLKYFLPNARFVAKTDHKVLAGAPNSKQKTLTFGSLTPECSFGAHFRNLRLSRAIHKPVAFTATCRTT